MGPVDDRELEQLLERQLPALQAFVRLRMGAALAARESSADVLQSVCRELLAARDRVAFEDEAAFRGWLYTAALHKILQKARHHGTGKRAVEREVAVDVEQLSRCYATCVTPSQVASAREQVTTMEAAFAELNERDREVITLARIAGLPHERIAAILDCSVEASRTTLRRALVKLAGLMQARGG